MLCWQCGQRPQGCRSTRPSARWVISRSAPALANQASSGRLSVVEDFGAVEHGAERGVGVGAVGGEGLVGADQQVHGQQEAFGDGARMGLPRRGGSSPGLRTTMMSRSLSPLARPSALLHQSSNEQEKRPRTPGSRVVARVRCARPEECQGCAARG